MPTLIVETGIEPQSEKRLMIAAHELGWDVVCVSHVPNTTTFVRADEDGIPGARLPVSVLSNTDAWFHGSIAAAKAAQQGTGWSVHAPFSALRCTSYYEQLHERLFQKDASVYRLSDVVCRQEDVFSGRDTVFIRPDGNDKVFSGMCLTRKNFTEGWRNLTFYDPPMETLVLVSSVREVRSEVRLLGVNGRVVTGSMYVPGRGTGPAEDALLTLGQEVMDFCVRKGFDPAPSWVLDLGLSDSGVWEIMEVGATSCCGFYACDGHAFLSALQGSAPDSV